MQVQTATIPSDLRTALEDVEGGMTTLGGMPADYRRRAILFIEQGSPHTRSFRISNFIEVVKFFQDSHGE